MSESRLAFALVLSGFAFQVMVAVFVSFIGFLWWPFGMGMMGYYGRTYRYGFALPWTAFWALWAAAVLVMGAFAAYLLGREKPDLRSGSILALFASIFAFPLMWGFMVGSLLMFTGSIIGLVNETA